MRTAAAFAIFPGRQCVAPRRWCLTLIFLLHCLLWAVAASAGRVVVNDAQGRQVAVPLPLKRVVTINTSSAAILRAIGVDMDAVVVGVTAHIINTPRFWPELRHKPGFRFTNLNYERLAELAPQLILLYRNSNLTADETKLAAIGAKWIYLDCNDLRTMDEDIRTLGRLFGRLPQAEALIRWYRGHERRIAAALAPVAPQDRPSVFHYAFVYTNLPKGVFSTKNRASADHALVKAAGGINIGAALPRENTVVSGEWLAEQNPQVVIGSVQGKRVSGYNADAAVAAANLQAIYRRLVDNAALRETRAVKDRRVLLISQELKEGPAAVIALAHIAKFLYPDRLGDIDPERIAGEYYEQWCGLPYSGVFTYSQ